MIEQRIGDQLWQLSRKVGRLRPDWRDPERYFEERDELERELRQVARTMGGRA